MLARNGGKKVMECAKKYAEVVSKKITDELTEVKDNKYTFITCGKTNLFTADFEKNFFYDYRKESHCCKILTPHDETRNCYKLAVYFDLVAFKVINDRFSHDLGDEILKQFSKMLKDEVERFSNDKDLNKQGYELLPFRHGGDEFTVLLIPSKIDCTEKNVYSVPNTIENDLKNLAQNIVSIWQEKRWVIEYSIITGTNSHPVFTCEEVGSNLSQQLEGKENQVMLLKGLELHYGVGDTIKDAEKASKVNDFKSNDGERGVINEKCYIGFPECNAQGEFSFDDKNWLQLKEHLIYIVDKNENTDDSINKFLSAANIDSEHCIHQNAALFVPVKIGYKSLNEEVLSLINSNEKFKGKVGYISWIDAVNTLKDKLLESAKEVNAYYLTGNSTIQSK